MSRTCSDVKCTYWLSIYQEGVKVGQQVLAVSDPVNESQLLSLREKPSKLALMRAINNRRYPEVELSFTPNVASVAQGIIDKAGGQNSVLHALRLWQKPSINSVAFCHFVTNSL